MLREVGLEIGPGRLQDSLRGLDLVDLTSQDDVYWALRQTLVSRRDELELFDRAFAAWFLRAPVLAPLRTLPQPQARPVAVAQSEADASRRRRGRAPTATTRSSSGPRRPSFCGRRTSRR